MNAKMDLLAGQQKLVLLWLIGSTPAILLMLIRTFTTGDKDIDRVWGWLLPAIMPTLSLVVGTYTAKALSSGEPKSVDTLLFRISVAVSTAYLLIVTAAVVLYPVGRLPGLLTLERVGIVLGPVQGLVSACLACSFFRTRRVTDGFTNFSKTISFVRDLSLRQSVCRIVRLNAQYFLNLGHSILVIAFRVESPRELRMPVGIIRV